MHVISKKKHRCLVAYTKWIINIFTQTDFRQVIKDVNWQLKVKCEIHMSLINQN